MRQPRPSYPSRGQSAVRQLGNIRAWSVTTWLIAICVVVFFVDTFTPARWVPVTAPTPISTDQPIPPDFVLRDPGRLPPNVQHIKLEVLDRQTHELVGYVGLNRMHKLTEWLNFSTARGFLGLEYWRFIGFQFLHYDMTHLLFNMLALFFFGPLVEQELGKKRFLAFYLLCGIFGAVLYLFLNMAGYITSMFDAGLADKLPLLLFNDPLTPLVGASAGVFGVLIAGAFLAPKERVYMFFVLPMQLRWVAYGLVVIAFFTLLTGGPNAGGEAGHLGGAIAGFYFIRRQHHLHGFFDVLGYVDPTSHHYRDKSDSRKSSKRNVKGVDTTATSTTPSRAEVDRILMKIQANGLDSLNSREQAILEVESKRRSRG